MKASIVICGAGIVGMATALGLARQGIKDIVLVGPLPKLAPMQRNVYHPRVYAISAASEQFLTELGVWSLMNQTRLTRVEAMEIKGDQFGALYLRAWQAARQSLTWIIESGEMERVLSQALQMYGVQWLQDSLESYGQGVGQTASGQQISADLWVAADGAGSKLRQMAGLSYDQTDYDAVGVVGHLSAEYAHQATAFQWFRPEGVLGILPMPDTDDGHQVSMVWSLRTDHANTLLSMAPDRQAQELAQSLAQATRGRLGRLSLRSALNGFAITLASSHMVGPQVALVGDAAHRVHPLAGQGLNLGLGDACALVQVICQRESYLSVADPVVLRRYRRARAQALLEMRLVTDGLKKLFDQTLPPLPWLRNAGMSLVDRLPFVKRLLIDGASRSA
jgi:ubiquinone biosynthesis UbiH/UbiF/VisC/COQ6 family hydroxylase